jgi:ketosteroid isomerase-like protein
VPVEHLQTVADAFEKWNRDDFAGAVEHFTEDAEWEAQISALDSSLYRGRAEIEGMFRDIAEHLELRMNFRHIEEIGDKVLVDVFATAAGKSSGAEVDAGWFQLYSFREGGVCRVQPFESRDDAVAAAEAS